MSTPEKPEPTTFLSGRTAQHETLPIPPQPSGSKAGRTMQESVYSPKPCAQAPAR